MLDDEKQFVRAANVGRLIMRQMLVAVSDMNELAVLWFIYARTHQFGNEEEKIPAKHFIEGVHDEYGICWTAPLPIARSTLYRAIDGVVSKGMVLRTKGSAARSPIYSINADWTIQGYMDETDLLTSRQRDSTVPPAGLISPSQGTYKEKDYKEKDLKGCAGTRARTPTQAVLENVTEENAMSTSAVDALREKMQRTVAKTDASIDKNKRKLNATALQDIWRDAFKKAHPTEKFFPWRVYEQSAFKKKVHEHIPLSQAEEFVQFCVKHFANVIADRLRWMKTPPRLPDVGFVTKQISTFWLAFDDMNDPNRVVRRRVDDAAAQPPKLKVKPKPTVSATKLAELETENAAMREKLRDIGKAEIKTRANRTQEARKLITNRKTSDPEFGKWDG